MVTFINFNDLFYLSYFMLPLIDCTQLTSHLPMLMPHLYLQLVLVYCVLFSEGLIIKKKKKKKTFWNKEKKTTVFFKQPQGTVLFFIFAPPLGQNSVSSTVLCLNILIQLMCACVLSERKTQCIFSLSLLLLFRVRADKAMCVSVAM